MVGHQHETATARQPRKAKSTALVYSENLGRQKFRGQIGANHRAE
jgi:hypothetical protein